MRFPHRKLMSQARHARRDSARVCILALTLGLSLAPVTGQAADPPPSKTYEFVNGRWFDGGGFTRRTFYASGGLLTAKAPKTVDEVVDLHDGYVVPPFGDAHNHYIAGPHDIDKILNEYLKDGIVYAKNPASIHRDSLLIADKINRPDSVDVAFANAGLTATGGHPVQRPRLIVGVLDGRLPHAGERTERAPDP